MIVACFCGATIKGNKVAICPKCKEPVEPWASEGLRKIKEN